MTCYRVASSTAFNLTYLNDCFKSTEKGNWKGWTCNAGFTQKSRNKNELFLLLKQSLMQKYLNRQRGSSDTWGGVRITQQVITVGKTVGRKWGRLSLKDEMWNRKCARRDMSPNGISPLHGSLRKRWCSTDFQKSTNQSKETCRGWTQANAR